LKDAFELAQNYYNSLGFGEKYIIGVNARNHLLRAESSMLKYDGFLFANSSYAVRCDSGEYHVYVWAHLLSGEIFYVGSGIDERWRCRYRLKNQAFMENLDAGDAVVYKIIEGVDQDTARFFERYLSLTISSSGRKLTNRDNNAEKCGLAKAREWLHDNATRLSDDFTRRVEDVVLNKILSESDFRGMDVLRIFTFRQIYGDHWFSQGKFLHGDDAV
jgi:hypothetical protein